ncbi:MAG TPA: acyltransferase [Pseudonocardiaceae bacterium]|jgi:peptidoglycan/LPS O-acetylase OafA/YrhL|nr:acyltransferase [Pseudonocardiaceae bacterium]
MSSVVQNWKDDRPRRLNSLTGLRFFGALAVVLCHVEFQFSDTASLTTAASYGYVGVSFFFMLSGFVLTWSANSDSPRKFMWRRFCRVWPLQFLLALVAFTVLSAQEQLPGVFGHISEVLLLQAWSPQQNVYFGGNGVSWSLSCEMFFYLLFPFVASLVVRLGRRGLMITGAGTVGALLAAPLVASLVGVSPAMYYWLFFIFPPYRFGEFLLGMVLARAIWHGLRVPRPGVAMLGAAAGLGVIIWVLTDVTLRTGIDVDRPFVALCTLPLFALLLLGGASGDLGSGRGWLSWWLPLRLGEWSFALYLVHKPVFLLTTGWGWWGNSGGVEGAVVFAAYLVVAIGAAAGLYYAAERPLERFLRGWGVPARAAGPELAVGQLRA